MSSDTKFGSKIANSPKNSLPAKGKTINPSSILSSRNIIASLDEDDDGNSAPDKSVSGS
jgi:hypothetical protein